MGPKEKDGSNVPPSFAPSTPRVSVSRYSAATVAMNTPPVSKIVRSPAFSADSMGRTEVSFWPFTVLAKGIVPRPGIEVIEGTQLPLAMPSALHRTK